MLCCTIKRLKYLIKYIAKEKMTLVFKSLSFISRFINVEVPDYVLNNNSSIR